MIFTNYKPTFLWGFAAIFTLIVAAMTYVLIRDGTPSGSSFEIMFGVMALFWFGAIGLATYATSQPCQKVAVQADGRVSVSWLYPFKVKIRSFPGTAIGPAQVIESQDDEGDPYYYARIGLTDGATVTLKESHQRESCEESCKLFNSATGKHAHKNIA